MMYQPVGFLSTLSLRRATQLYDTYAKVLRVFLSTLSLRRATVGAVLELQCVLDFYPRSPCGERHTSIAGRITSNDFYPRSPCGERRYIGSNVPNFTHFYPRSPCGERRWLRCWQLAARDISIHALLAESDRRHRSNNRGPIHFYPRSPCGERRKPNKLAGLKLVFLSTLSLRLSLIHI